MNKLSFPKYFSIQTTSLCNASCVFCPYKDIKSLFPQKIMDMVLYRKIIDECSNYKNVERVILYMNNEPLTDPYLIERINYAKEKIPWANVHILTNGLLLTDEMAEKLINSKLDWIGISFHGIRKETIEKSMGMPFELSFKRILNFIEKAKTKREIKEFIMVTFLRHKYLTYEEKEETINFWKSKNIERISYFDRSISRAGNAKDLPKSYHKEKIIGCKSIWAEEMIHIVEDGKVVLCCMDWKREVILGDLNINSINEVWNGKRKEVWKMISGKKDMPTHFLCKICEEAAVLKDQESVLLVFLPPWGVDTPPLGIACLSSYLAQNGISVDVFDLNIELFNTAPHHYQSLWGMNYSHWWRDQEKYSFMRRELNSYLEPLIEKILQSPHRIIGFSLPTNCSDLLLEEIVKRIKEKDSTRIIALGGVSISIKEQRVDLLQKIWEFIDYCVLGEGEETFCELATRIFEGRLQGIEDLQGILTKANYEADKRGAQISNLDAIPFPLFESFSLKKYLVPESLPMEFSRGCIGNCPFCDFKSTSPMFRSKSPSYIFHQIKLYQQRYEINHISLCDSAVNGNMEVLEGACDLLFKNNISVDISALAIPRKEMTLDLLKKMKKAGFYRLEYGVESGSNSILKKMRKIFTAEIAERVLRDTFQAEIKTYLYFIVGFPGETAMELNETKEFIKRNARFITIIKSINPLYIMAGSEIFRNPDKFGIIFPADKGDSHWYIGKENTVEIRKRGVQELKQCAESMNISFTEEAENLEFTKLCLKKQDASKTEVLLVMCPMWDISLPPLGISYLAAYLENKGIPVDILDTNIETYAKSDSTRKALWKMENYNLWAWENLFKEIKKSFMSDIEHYVENILRANYKIIGFSLYGANTLFSIELATRLKQRKPDLFIIFGGPSCSFLHSYPDMPIRLMVSFQTRKSLVAPGIVDAFVLGEGEETLFNLCYNLLLSNKVSSIPGVISYKNGKYTVSSHSLLIKKLDRLFYPAWEKFLLNLYSLKNSLPIIFSRGCINKCSFCNDWKIWQGKYRRRTALNIFQEMTIMLEKFNVNTFQCNDLLFNGDLKMLEELSGYLIKSKINIQWSAQGVTRRDMSLSLLKKLKKSGLYWITYGVESLSENVLKMMNKKYTYEDIQKALRNTKKAKISVSINLIVGFPNEAEEDFKLTMNRLASNKNYIDEISSLSPCYITADTDLENKPEDFSVSLSKENLNYYWKSLRGKNTYELRKRRTKELSEFAKRLGIKVSFTGIYDEKDELNNLTIQDKKEKKQIYKWKRGNNIDFLFINLPPWAQENPHIGVAYLGSYLRSKGLKMGVIDLNKRFCLGHPNHKMLWHVENKNFWSNKDTFPLILEIFKEDIEKAIREILSFDNNILGFSVVDPKERLTIEFIKRIKEKAPNKKIILGGPATSTNEQRKIFLDHIANSIDAFVVGEGEESLFHLLDAFINKRKIDVEGCYIRNNGKWNYKEKTSLIPLDKIPFPTYDEFDLSLYGKSLLVEWSRGCRGSCTFCKNYRLFAKYRPKPADWVLNELIHHKERHNIDEFTVVDNILNGDIRSLNAICHKIITENLQVRWTGQIAPHQDMNSDVFKNMKQAGCFKLQIGLESGSNKVLKLMRKTFNAKISEQNIRLAKKAGIKTEVFIIVGFPGETKKDFRETHDFIKRNAKYIDTLKSINTLHLIAGTEVYEKAREKFNMKALPKESWHYLWETYDGNNYQVRKKRAEILLDLSDNLGIEVMETNIREGKESTLEDFEEKKRIDSRLTILNHSINSLQNLPQKGRIIKKKRSMFKWLILIFVSFYTFSYIIYFWIYMHLRNKVLLGGRKI